MHLVDSRFGRTVASAGPYTLYVPGDPSVGYGLDLTPRSVVAGSSVAIEGFITNTGATTWADPTHPTIPVAELEARLTTLSAWWLPAEPAPGGMDPAHPRPAAHAPVPVRLGPVRLAPGGTGPLKVTLVAPAATGRWTLLFDVADVAGSFAARGSAPAAISVTVTPQPVPQPF